MLLSGLGDASASSDFGVSNLPLSVFSALPFASKPRCCTRLGDIIIDLSVLEEAGLFHNVPGLSAQVFCQETLNSFLEHPRPVWIALRHRLTELLTATSESDSTPSVFHSNPRLQEAACHLVSDVTLHLPIQIGDYTDFYASREHATNVGYALLSDCSCVIKSLV
jgi:fumarylacetoacetase